MATLPPITLTVESENLQGGNAQVGHKGSHDPGRGTTKICSQSTP